MTNEAYWQEVDRQIAEENEVIVSYLLQRELPVKLAKKIVEAIEWEDEDVEYMRAKTGEGALSCER